VEWSYHVPSVKGNPFDTVAVATFHHAGGGDPIRTHLYFDGRSTWKLRFTGTRSGKWTFTTESKVADLNGLKGEVVVEASPKARGFLTKHRNKFARQIAEDGQLEAVRFNVYMNLEDNPWRASGFTSSEVVKKCIRDARQYGFDTVFVSVCNNWFQFGTLGWNEHKSENPDRETFEALERLIMTAHREGMSVQIWAWGDESRKQTPIGVGGINGPADRRLQRYIAARLGPLPGWTLGYGFDLQEWVTEEQVGSWAKYLHEHFGWQHMVWARGRSHPELDVKSYSGSSDHGRPFSYDDAVAKLDSGPERPHLYEERFAYLRDGAWTMDNTRRALWDYTMAGGIGAWWGFYSGQRWEPPPYPEPDQLRTVNEFWRNRFLLDMHRANNLAGGGYCLKTPSNVHYVFYAQNASTMKMDLSKMVGDLPAVAVDTKQAYKEIDLGMLAPGSRVWKAPYKSDWAIAVGRFER